jgi:hypothetical protein
MPVLSDVISGVRGFGVYSLGFRQKTRRMVRGSVSRLHVTRRAIVVHNVLASGCEATAVCRFHHGSGIDPHSYRLLLFEWRPFCGRQQGGLLPPLPSRCLLPPLPSRCLLPPLPSRCLLPPLPSCCLLPPLPSRCLLPPLPSRCLLPPLPSRCPHSHTTQLTFSHNKTQHTTHGGIAKGDACTMLPLPVILLHSLHKLTRRGWCALSVFVCVCMCVWLLDRLLRCAWVRCGAGCGCGCGVGGGEQICLLMMGAAMEMMALLLVSPLAAFLLGSLLPPPPFPRRSLLNFQPAAAASHLGAGQGAYCPLIL